MENILRQCLDTNLVSNPLTLTFNKTLIRENIL